MVVWYFIDIWVYLMAVGYFWYFIHVLVRKRRWNRQWHWTIKKIRKHIKNKNIPNNHKIYPAITKYTKWPLSIPNDEKIYQMAIKYIKGSQIYQHFPFQSPPKYTQILTFCVQTSGNPASRFPNQCDWNRSRGRWRRRRVSNGEAI
jgi:hypothetical protein